MKRITLLACLCLMLSCSGQLLAQQGSGQAAGSRDQVLTTIVLVRHAEKWTTAPKIPN